jgi:excisionase family DNA binding protein
MNDEQQEKKLLTIDEAGKTLGLGRSMTYNLVASKELASIKIGKSRRIPLSAIDDFIKRRLQDQRVKE